ncbi:FecR domain-containing protein [Candidatus Peregrinibacteria bacterium]|nr:FecR domain-containing protein [Candidatus Peregrinibacteria bacterium]
MKFLDRLLQKKIAPYAALENKLKQCSNISLPREKQAGMKRLIMASLQAQKKSFHEASLADLIEKIKNLASQIHPSAAFQSLLKEKLITVAEFHARRFSFIPFWIRNHRRFWASIVAAVFVFGLFFNFTFKIPNVEASFVTSLGEINGDVTVMRGEQVILGAPNFLLKSDDVVRTGANSKAVIRFLDQSVSRLDENTEVKISKLFMNPANKTETVVELVLHRGRLWSRVINLINNFSRFQVKAKNTVAVAKKKAAFDVSVTAKGKAKVSAVQNKVDLVVATDKKIIETTLVKGFTAEVKTDTPLAPQIRQELQPADQKDQWVAENLAADKQYIETVKQENQTQINSQVQVLPGSPFYGMKELSEGTKIALTLDDFARRKKVFLAAQEKFAEAQVLLTKGETEKARVLLDAFKVQVQNLLQWILDHEADDPVQILTLKTQITEALSAYEKQLSLLLPTDPLYALKEVIGQVKLLTATDPQQKTQELASQAGDKLLEAHDLAEQGDTETAQQQVKEYSKAISEAVSDLKQLPSDAKEQAVTTLLDNKAEDLKILEAIAAGTTSVIADGLQIAVTDAKTDTLTKIGEAVLNVQQTGPSSEVLKKLEGIKNIDVNGKSVVDVTLTKDRVDIKSDGAVIAVTGTTTLPAASASKEPLKNSL